jgi:hypothetical protein
MTTTDTTQTKTDSTQATTADSHGSGGRTAGAVIVGIVGVIGVLIAAAGIALVGVHTFLRDDDGYYTTGTERLETDRYALASDEIDLGAKSAGFDADEAGVSLRFSAESADAEPVFVGVARKSDAAAYLDGVGYAQVDDLSDDGPSYTEVRGHAPAGDPSSQDFWVSQSEGTGRQVVDWDIESGSWTAVVMNTDAGRGVSVDAEAGAKISWLVWVGAGLAVGGLLIAGGCGFGLRRLLRS